MTITPHQAKYYAHELTKRSPASSVEKLAASLSDAQVDLNPHQIDAALFAFRSPLSKGAILADEVGLGKTVEAGLLLSQKWAERKRKLLVIAPATLRKQWSQELSDKFHLSSAILEKISFDSAIRTGNLNPFDQTSVVICSYQFASAKEAYLKQIPWDLVVIDEAHRLRNVYKPNNRIANAIKNGVSHAPKALLTATPLQNSLLELYGLVSVVDEYIFGDLKSFKAQFATLRDDDDFKKLRERLKTVCQRTLRRQVLEYIRYTNRIPLTQEFFPNDDEQKLYDVVSDYLQRENLIALPSGQRQLMTLILRKLLASSTFAISGTLDTLVSRLQGIEANSVAAANEIDVSEAIPDLESAQQLADEWENDDDDDGQNKVVGPEQLESLRHELRLLQEFQKLAHSIVKNSKGEVLLVALQKGFEKLQELGAQKKAIIFTESTRTQSYLRNVLTGSAYAGKVVTFNGSNSDPHSKTIYKEWLERHKGTDKVSGSPTADIRAALVEHFRDSATIMIATEAAAEGVNLQFCSFVVNFDLPWNPQRIEQRIGRCHRYGQKYDVVVVNFLNKKNAADQRVYELLSEKFKLFSGVFGASDEVLGAIESGVDFEKRIAVIYQRCRTPEQIEFEFNQLQKDLEEQIENRMKDTRTKLLENFDEEVQEKLRVGKIRAEEMLSKHECWLWEVTKFFLNEYAKFEKEERSFMLEKNPFPGETIHSGPYRFGKTVEDANTYRAGHPLAQKILERAKSIATGPEELEFDLSSSGKNVAALSRLIGEAGWLMCVRVSVTALEVEDLIVLAGRTDDGEILDEDQCKRMLDLSGVKKGAVEVSSQVDIEMRAQVRQRVTQHVEAANARGAEWMDEEVEKLDRWAEDRRSALKTALDDLDSEIKEHKKAARIAPNLPDKLELQKKLRGMELKRDEVWRSFDTASREIDLKKETLLDDIGRRLQQQISEETIFEIRWRLK